MVVIDVGEPDSDSQNMGGAIDFDFDEVEDAVEEK